MIDETERTCQGDCFCKVKIAKEKNKNSMQIKTEGNNFKYLKVLRHHEGKDTNSDFVSPINKDSQI